MRYRAKSLLKYWDSCKLGRIFITQFKSYTMDTNFNYVHVKASERLENSTKEKLSKLKERYDFLVSAEVYYKTEKSSSNQKGRIVEIELSVPGPRIFASSNEENFDMALSKTINDLKRQLQKKKEKMSTHL